MPGQVAESSSPSTTSDYEREWREGVAKRLDDVAKRNQDTALIQERILARLDGHDLRIERLEGASDKVSDRVTQQRIELDSRLIGWLVAALMAAYALLSGHIVFR